MCIKLFFDALSKKKEIRIQILLFIVNKILLAMLIVFRGLLKMSHFLTFYKYLRVISSSCEMKFLALAVELLEF